MERVRYLKRCYQPKEQDNNHFFKSRSLDSVDRVPLTETAGEDGCELGVDRQLEPLFADQLLLGGRQEVGVLDLGVPTLAPQVLMILLGENVT